MVLVTGVGRGLGRALVHALHGCGARVAGCARTDTDLRSLERELASADDPPHLVPVDVRDERAIGRFVEGVMDRWGRIDGLINNASILGTRTLIRDADPDEWRRVIDVGLTGAFVACRAVIPALRASGGGSIVNVSSGVGDRPREGWGAYAVAKWALEGLSWNLALEEGASGIRVNVVDPGRMRTGMRLAAYPQEDRAALPDPADVTGVFVWLMGTGSVGTTGQRFRAQDWTPPRTEPAPSALDS